MARARALSKMDFNTFTIGIQPKNKTIIADVLISSRPSVRRVPSAFTSVQALHSVPIFPAMVSPPL